MSVIETPPKDRLAIHTVVAHFDPELIRTAIEQELSRGGQVYFVHNRVDSIFMRAAMIQELLPSARIGVGHGQMGEAELETRAARLHAARVRCIRLHHDRRERARTFRLRTQSSSRMRSGTAYPNCTSCEDASAGRIAGRMRTCWFPPIRNSATSLASALLL